MRSHFTIRFAGIGSRFKGAVDEAHPLIVNATSAATARRPEGLRDNSEPLGLVGADGA